MTTKTTTPPPAARRSGQRSSAPLHGSAQKSLRAAFSARSVPDAWSATSEDRDQVKERLAEFSATANKHTRYIRGRGAQTILRWLEEFPGDTWQQRWRNSGSDDQRRAWLDHLIEAIGDGRYGRADRPELSSGALALVCADVIRPSLEWLMTRQSLNLRQVVTERRDPDGFAALAGVGAPELWSTSLGFNARYQIAMLIVAKGGGVRDITVGDCLELRETEARVYVHAGSGRSLFYNWLRELGNFPAQAPTTLRDVSRHSGQVSAAELVDRYQLRCRPVRDLIVDYLTERQPSLDYNSLEDLSRTLARHFWGNLERHHPGIDSLRLSPEVSAAWKERCRTKTQVRRLPDGTSVEVTSPRTNSINLLTAVRAFYLDLAQRALEEPARWGPWVAPCPVKEAEISQRKHVTRRKARMDQRTRERLPVLPTLVKTAADELKKAQARLTAVRAAAPGTSFTVLGEIYTKVKGTRYTDHAASATAYDANGRRQCLGPAEQRAFWAWASVEFLRHTGVRIEEMLEASHHSITQYRLPTTGEVVPLLQIAPSKTDEERLLLVSPELADVLSAMVCRVRDASGAIPLVRSYDPSERDWNAPLPLLFQWRWGGQNRPVSVSTIRKGLDETLLASGLADSNGQPLRYQPHDFRRMFVTDAIMSGLPPHIAQVICGHKTISTTMSYKAVYPTEAIEAHRAFIARRRALRPSEEYRTPTSEEWDAFLAHFEKRKLSVGTCARAFGTACVHEHACIRCSMLRPEPEQRSRLVEIRDNLIARIAEAEREGWLGEVEGLQVSLAGAQDKLDQLDGEAARRSSAASLGMPTFAEIAKRSTTSTDPRHP
ncbi:site-specific integrase [Streptomyces sp. H27-S2]|uniref:site-specific integrase n=1 Tax=Streptomyces antarcticus TaxID=2996458 RepID=UPI00226FF6D2|nr:site-specific integrase [Streptomyces sp. H27-S2]MCY0954768.1 site-specific integrase [Streptomyces sp. H27-S2]